MMVVKKRCLMMNNKIDFYLLNNKVTIVKNVSYIWTEKSC